MKRGLLLAAIVSIAAPLSSQATAQRVTPGAVTTGSPRDRTVEDKIRSDEIERVRREAEKPDTARPAADPRFPQIKEDFERIQIINSDVLQTGANAAALDLKRISDAASEIKKRGARLKSNMFPAEPEAESAGKTPEAEAPTDSSSERQDLKSLLGALDHAIDSFVHNPIFQNTSVVDPQNSVKANRDLDKIIWLSQRIRKEADRLKKASGG